jgi:hypothetical protein
MTAKQIIWVPIVGDIFIVSRVKSLNDLDKFFTNKTQIVLYVVFQTLMWFLYAYGLMSLIN